MLIAINKRLEAFRRNEKGFTMLEVLMVVVVLGIIAGIVGPKLLGSADPAKEKADELVIERLNAAMEVYYLDMGAYPADATTATAALVTVPNPRGNWGGPYVKAVPAPESNRTKTFKWDTTTNSFQVE